jgi:GNAT superfamily N-acetyltransferase
VTVHEKLEERRSSGGPLTLSGARIEVIPVCTARSFLARMGEQGEMAGFSVRAWGAYEHSEALIGVAVLAISTSPRGHFFVAVVPARRNLGIGGELLLTLVGKATQRGMRTLTCRHPADDPAVEWLVTSLDLKAARRVHEKIAVTTLLVSGSMSDHHQGGVK